MRLPPRAQQLGVISAGFGVAFVLLRRAFPIYWDGSGPIPSFFYFGRLPTSEEFYKQEFYYTTLFYLPYFVAAAILALAGTFLIRAVARHSGAPWD